MKANATEEFLGKLDPVLVSALLYGADPTLTSHNLHLLLKNYTSDALADDFSITKFPSGEGQNRSAIVAACTERSFFANSRRVVIFEGATNQHTKTIESSLARLTPEDAFLVVCAGDLDHRSSLLKLYETTRNTLALAPIKQVWTAASLSKYFSQQGAPEPDKDAATYLIDLGREHDWGSFQMLLDKVALYVRGSEKNFGLKELDDCGASLMDSQLQDDVQIGALTDAVAEGRVGDVAHLCQVLAANGVNPVTLVILVSYHFSMLQRALAKSPKKSAAQDALRRLPMHPARKKAVQKQLDFWNLATAEAAMQTLHKCDFNLRGGSPVSHWTTAERSLGRIAANIFRQISRR